MALTPRKLIAGIGGRLRSLPLPALLALVGFAVVASGAGGYYAYQAYDYVQHDNEFCFSCHLMQEPYELFAQSAHRGLGCKACHQPNIIDRSTMGITAVVVDPDTISAHSEVPNDLCADCHINGDPERWQQVAASAGHRVHLESTDTTLQGLQCVECHSSSLHQFTAVDETCAQSGCHTDSGVQLGAMSDLTIHCAACHGFSAPSPDVESALTSIAPDEDTCLSCHAMRVLVEMPDDDPHERACASCHNPHEQATPEEAAASCATGACHTDPVSLTPFHEGLTDDVAADCLYCHQAHDFHVDGSNCTACHQDILQDDPAVRRSAATPHASTAAVRVAAAAVDARTLAPGTGVMHAAAPTDAFHSWGYPLSQPAPVQTLDFRHSEHASVECADCHESTQAHGTITVTTVTDCRSCHHTDRTVSADGCAACHERAEASAEPYAVRTSFALSTGAERSRALPFEHAPHESLDCAQCHTEGLELSAAAADCASCHEEHHVPETTCRSCHVEAPEGSHVIETAHVTCSGAGCHQDGPFEAPPRNREVCLVCHQDQVDHRPDGDCAECHALSDIGAGP